MKFVSNEKIIYVIFELNDTEKKKYLDTRTADSIRRQAQRELEKEKALANEFQRAINLKEHYFGNRQVHYSILIVSYGFYSLGKKNKKLNF